MEKENWKTWTNNNFENFKTLKNGSKIAIMIEKQADVILLNKKEKEIRITSEDSMKLTEPYPQIAFQLKEKTATEILNNKYSLLKELMLNDEIKIYSFASTDKLIQMGYEEFLKNLGFEIKQPTDCGCGCC